MGKKLENLIGETFNRLTVVGIGKKNKWGRNQWICQCDCGNMIEAVGSVLKTGKTKSCGCLQKEIVSKRSRKDFTGKTFSRLLVIKHIGVKKQESWYECLCDCGNITEISGDNLQSGKTKSCGCYKFEVTSKRSRKDFTNQRFGRLLAVEHLGTRKNSSWYRCRCDCGNIVEVSGNNLRRKGTKSCGCLGTESYISQELKKYFVINYSALVEYRIFKNPKTGYYLPYDIYIPDNIFIEVQGEQHYKKTVFSMNLKNIKYRDRIKKKYAKENGIFIEVDLRKEKTVDEWIEYINKIINLNKR